MAKAIEHVHVEDSLEAIKTKRGVILRSRTYSMFHVYFFFILMSIDGHLLERKHVYGYV